MHKTLLWWHHSNNEIIIKLHYVRFDETSRNVQLLCFCSGYSRSHNNSTSKCLQHFQDVISRVVATASFLVSLSTE